MDVELKVATDMHILEKRMYVLRIGRLCDDSPTTFNAREQAMRFFEADSWKPKRLRATRQANDFVWKVAFDLTMFKAKQQRQKELVEEEEKEESGDDSDARFENSRNKQDGLGKLPRTRSIRRRYHRRWVWSG